MINITKNNTEKLPNRAISLLSIKFGAFKGTKKCAESRIIEENENNKNDKTNRFLFGFLTAIFFGIFYLSSILPNQSMQTLALSISVIFAIVSCLTISVRHNIKIKLPENKLDFLWKICKILVFSNLLYLAIQFCNIGFMKICVDCKLYYISDFIIAIL